MCQVNGGGNDEKQRCFLLGCAFEGDHEATFNKKYLTPK